MRVPLTGMSPSSIWTRSCTPSCNERRRAGGRTSRSTCPTFSLATSSARQRPQRGAYLCAVLTLSALSIGGSEQAEGGTYTPCVANSVTRVASARSLAASAAACGLAEGVCSFSIISASTEKAPSRT